MKVRQLDYKGMLRDAKTIRKVAKNYIKRKRDKSSTSIIAPVEHEQSYAPAQVTSARTSEIQ